MPQPLGTSSLFSSYCVYTIVSKYAELQHDYLLVQNTSQGNENEHKHNWCDCNIQIQLTSRCTCGKDTYIAYESLHTVHLTSLGPTQCSDGKRGVVSRSKSGVGSQGEDEFSVLLKVVL